MASHTDLARTTDPNVSHVAAKRCHQETRASDKSLLLGAVDRAPGHTCAEYAGYLMWSCFNSGLAKDQAVRRAYRMARMVTKRMSDLEASADVCVVGERTCHVTGHKARTWRATEA